MTRIFAKSLAISRDSLRDITAEVAIDWWRIIWRSLRLKVLRLRTSPKMSGPEATSGGLRSSLSSLSQCVEEKGSRRKMKTGMLIEGAFRGEAIEIGKLKLWWRKVLRNRKVQRLIKLKRDEELLLVMS